MQEKLLTTAEVAETLRCSIGTVRIYIREGRFSQVYFIGKAFLVSENALDEFIENNNIRGKGRID